MQLGQSEVLSMFGVGTMDAGDGLLATQIGMGFDTPTPEGDGIL
jgi:hypothetical protein